MYQTIKIIVISKTNIFQDLCGQPFPALSSHRHRQKYGKIHFQEWNRFDLRVKREQFVEIGAEISASGSGEQTTDDSDSWLTYDSYSWLTDDSYSWLTYDSSYWLTEDSYSWLKDDSFFWLIYDSLSWLTDDSFSWLSIGDCWLDNHHHIDFVPAEDFYQVSKNKAASPAKAVGSKKT